MTDFRIFGPYSVVPKETSQGNSTYVIDDPAARRSKHSLSRYGCYVFARKWGDKYTLWYVGKSGRPLKEELFTLHKIAKLDMLARRHERGAVVVFLIVPVGKTGRPAKSVVGEVETYFIHQAHAVNSALLNERKIRRRKWDVEGVTQKPAPGRPKTGDGTKTFRDMMLG